MLPRWAQRSTEIPPTCDPPLQPVDWDRKDGTINYKLPKNSNTFNGRILDYEVWANRVRDHLMMGNVGWGRHLDLVEADRYALALERIRSFTDADGCWLDLEFIGTKLWTFLGQFAIGDHLYARRVQMVGGETYNGLELWRRLYVEHKCGAEEAAMAGPRRLHNFPQCPGQF